MKGDVFALFRVEGLEEVAAELFAGRAAEALASPDGSDGVVAAVALQHGGLQLLAERFRRSQRVFDFGGVGLGQAIVEIGVQEFAGDFGGHDGPSGQTRMAGILANFASPTSSHGRLAVHRASIGLPASRPWVSSGPSNQPFATGV